MECINLQPSLFRSMEFTGFFFVLCLSIFVRQCASDSEHDHNLYGTKGVHLSDASNSSSKAMSNSARIGLPWQGSMIVGLINDDGSVNNDFIDDGYLNVEGDVLEKLAVVDLVSSPNKLDNVSPRERTYKFEVCPPRMKDYIPCLDNWEFIKRLPSTARGEQWERHCPIKSKKLCCLIATPAGYKTPIRWPRSKDEVWYSNIPHTRVMTDKGAQNWISVADDKLKFPAGGSQSVNRLSQMVPGIAYGVRTRVALDVVCGIASWGAYLLKHDVLTLSIAPKDVHEIHFALERGLPAMVAVLATHRLLYPSQAFDLIHCSHCLIDWARDDGILLVEVDRLLRAGAYFVWAEQPLATDRESNQSAWSGMEDLASRLCWTLIARDEKLGVWQKPFNNACYLQRELGTLPSMCDPHDDPDAVWYIPLKACISWLPKENFLGNLSEWPVRLSVPSKRLQIAQRDTEVSMPEVFKAEQSYWNEIVSGYLRGLGLKKENVRNVMDMRAGYGGFAAALVHQHVDWWVMNVVPINGPNTLPIIYDRGLLGVVHDWCEPFDTYPRTYDLLHAVALFTSADKRCNIAHIILEMDRILRPGGWVLIRESKAMVATVDALARSVRWKPRILETESGPFGKDKLLACQKHRWHS